MKKLIDLWKNYKYKKDLLITIAAILIGLLAVSADGFSDLANKAFWWNFWSVIHVAAIVTSITGWVYLRSKDKNS